jgi:hypothetical protein
MIISNIEFLKNMIKTRKIKLTYKPQKCNGENYFFNPNLIIILYNMKIVEINEKYLVIEFDMNDLQQLKIKNTSNELKEFIKKQINIDNHIFYDMFIETKNEKVRIRCQTPQQNGIYNFEYIRDNVKQPYKDIYMNSKIKECEIIIKNIWKQDFKIGFNIMFKSIKQ